MSKKYKELCDDVDSVGEYMTDPIGKCLRTVSGGPPFRIDLDYSNSETYNAYQRKEKLFKKFRLQRSEPAYLQWIEKPNKNIKGAPLPILVDRKSGIICEVLKNGTRRYGFLSDVSGCVFYHENWKPY